VSHPSKAVAIKGNEAPINAAVGSTSRHPDAKRTCNFIAALPNKFWNGAIQTMSP